MKNIKMRLITWIGFLTARASKGKFLSVQFVMIDGNNEWSEAKKLPAPINSDAAEWSPFVSAKGTLYFCSTRNRRANDGRIYKCEEENGVYKEPELLNGEIIDDDAGDPAVSPDEKFIVFASPKKERLRRQ